MEEESTVVDLKQNFLASQIRLLSAPLRPTRTWSNNVRLADDQAELNNAVIEEVLFQVNTIARHHNQAVYSSQAARHVAEQIDALYWKAGATDQAWGRAGDEDVLNKGVDLTEEENITRLPELWVEPEEGSQRDQAKYQALRNQLNELATELKDQKTKKSQYQHLQQLLKPLDNPKENVQPNLVTRNGELAKELDRMRVLIARVSSKLETLVDETPPHENDLDMADLDEASRAKIQSLLERPGPGD